MADQYDGNARNPGSVIDDDDPLAELARIIGYDRPAGSASDGKGSAAPASRDSGEIDLEAELLGELEPSYVALAPQRSTVAEPPALDQDGDFEADDAFGTDASIVEEPVADYHEPVSADPVGGEPDEPLFDPFSPADEPATGHAFIEDTYEEQEAVAEDDLAVAMDADSADIDLPEEDLYKALEDELTISDEELPASQPESAGPESLVADFGDEEAPADDDRIEAVSFETPITYTETFTDADDGAGDAFGDEFYR